MNYRSTIMRAGSGLAFAMMLLATGCSSAGASDGTAEGPTADAHAPLLAQVELPNGGTVSFTEPEPGVLVTSESGPIDNLRTPASGERRMDAVQLYEYLSGESAPSALVQAVARSKVPQPQQPMSVPTEAQLRASEQTEPLAPPRADSIVEKSLKQSTSTDFVGHFCNHFSGQDGNRIADWEFRTGSGSFQWNDLIDFESAAFTYRGAIRFVAKKRTWWTWSNLADETIPEGWYERVVASTSNLDFDGKAAVSEADGDGYHFCSAAWARSISD